MNIKELEQKIIDLGLGWIDDFIAMELMDPDDYFNEEVLNL